MSIRLNKYEYIMNFWAILAQNIEFYLEINFQKYLFTFSDFHNKIKNMQVATT